MCLQVFSILNAQEQEDEANFYSLMFVVLAVGSGIFTFLQVRNPRQLHHALGAVYNSNVNAR